MHNLVTIGRVGLCHPEGTSCQIFYVEIDIRQTELSQTMKFGYFAGVDFAISSKHGCNSETSPEIIVAAWL